MLHAGFAARCITPPPGKEIPGLFETRYAKGMHDDLFARAAILDDGSSLVALVQLDAIEASRSLVTQARSRAKAWSGDPRLVSLVAATHTHSGGPTFDGLGAREDAGYARFVADQAAAAVAEAYRRRRSVYAAAAAEDARRVAFNRRFAMNNGSQRTHPGKMHPDIARPAGPEDPRVTVIGFRDAATFTPAGCIVNFACHATHMNGLLYSADYPRWIVDTLQAVYGPEFGVVFLNGACGDVTQMDNRDPRPAEFGTYWCERTGRAIGGAALQAFARLDLLKDATIAARSTTVRAAIRSSPPEDVKTARALLAKAPVSAADVETIYARELLEVEAMRRKCATRTLEIMGIRVADALLWGVPAEFFQAFALDVRAASPFPHTCCVELANGYEGYICTPEAFAGGGYEVRTARSSLLEIRAGERIAAAAKRLARRMYDDAETEMRTTSKRRWWPTIDDPALDGINQLNRK